MTETRIKGYIHTLVVGYLLLFLINASLSITGISDFSVWFAAYYPFLIIISYIGLNALVSLLTRIIPQDKINIHSWCFKTFKKERKIYELLGVKKFKDKIPDMGGVLTGFSKSELTSSDPRYLERFIKETILGELSHLLGILCCVVIFIVFNEHTLNFALPLFFLNTYFNLMPLIVQRYNRPKLCKIYERQVAHSNQKINEDVMIEVKDGN